MSTTGFFLKRTVKFCDDNPPKINDDDDENPQPPSPNQSPSKLNNPNSRDSSTTPNISIEANQDIIKNVFTPTENITPNSALILST